MKKILFILLFGFMSTTLHSQDNAIKTGEKTAITFFDFDFAAGYWGEKSRACCKENNNDTEQMTTEVIIRNLEKKFNERYKVELEPAVIDQNGKEGMYTFKCFPRVKTKEAITKGYDKIIEIDAYLRPSAAPGIGIGPVTMSNPKPVMHMNVNIKDINGKTIWNKSAKVKEDEREFKVGVLGFNVDGGFSGDAIVELYNAVLEKIFSKVDKQSSK